MVRIAIAQIKIAKQPDKNVAKIAAYIKAAASDKCDLICFPETSLGDCPLKLTDTRIARICRYCRIKSIYGLIGAQILENDRLFNAAILIDRNGKIRAIHRKRHLFPGLDLARASPGSRNTVIKTDFGKIAVIICWDFAFQQDIRRLVNQGAEIILCPAYLMQDAGIDSNTLRCIAATRAFENACYFVLCDGANKDVLKNSVVCGPMGVLTQLSAKEEMKSISLNLAHLKKWRKLLASS